MLLEEILKIIRIPAYVSTLALQDSTILYRNNESTMQRQKNNDEQQDQFDTV